MLNRMFDKLKGLLISLFLVTLLAGCQDEVLLSDLDQRQANETLSVLQKQNINAIKESQGKGLFRVKVAKNDQDIAVQILQEYNLPSPKRFEVSDAFPADALVASPQAEKARLLSAIEQRLEQSLISLVSVVNAKVHISYPVNNTLRQKVPSRASALIIYEGDIDADELSTDIKMFIKNAFNDLDSRNITVLLFKKQEIVRSQPSDTSSLVQLSHYYWLALLPIIFIVIFLAYQRRKKNILHDLKTNKATE